MDALDLRVKYPHLVEIFGYKALRLASVRSSYKLDFLESSLSYIDKLSLSSLAKFEHFRREVKLF